jgi:DNA-binding protein HU-beta
MLTKSKSYTKSSRCWPAYEPAPGKSEHEEGSCRKKPASRNGGKEVSREKARKKQISLGGKRAQQAKAKSSNEKERRSVSKRRKAA